jgi:hypothetical protein
MARLVEEHYCSVTTDQISVLFEIETAWAKPISNKGGRLVTLY